MANLTSVTGFYYQIGSIDYPLNFSPDDKFGFDSEGQENAVFKYSINDVEKAVTKCRTLTKRAAYNTANTSIILADNSEGLLTTVDINSNNSSTELEAWNAAFKIAEYLYNNQSSSGNNPLTSGYISYGDEMLGNPSNNNEHYVPNYVVNSLAVQGSTHQQRLQWARFSVSGFTGTGNVAFFIYFDADAFVERSENVSYKVYRYEDIESPNDDISAEEFKSQIISKQFDILSSGKYKTWGELVVDKVLSDTETVEEQFFIYSSVMVELTDDIKKTQVKSYLLDKYPEDMTYLRYTYPTLFSENEIRIIPVYDNSVETTTGSAHVVHPLSILKLSSVLTQFGFSIQSTNSDYRPTEIFYVGPGAGWNPGNEFRFNFPLIAVEVDTASGIVLPISKRFPSYRPIYGENDGGEAAEFHFILIMILGYLMGLNQALTDEFKKQYSVNDKVDDVIKRKVVTFTFSGNIWTIYGPLTAATA